VFTGDANANALTLTGWVADPSTTDGTTGVDGLDVYLGTDLTTPLPLAGARMGQKRDDQASNTTNPAWVDSGFTINLPLDAMPAGPNQLTLVAHTPDGGTWLSSLAVVMPNLGSVPAPPVLASANPGPVAVTAPLPPFHAEVESPQPGDQVSRGTVVQVLAPGADRVDVFLEPDRDDGGKLVGSATRAVSNTGVMNVSLSLPTDAHTLYVHVASSVTGQQALFTVPVVVR
jgi:hypothetical protein